MRIWSVYGFLVLCCYVLSSFLTLSYAAITPFDSCNHNHAFTNSQELIDAKNISKLGFEVERSLLKLASMDPAAQTRSLVSKGWFCNDGGVPLHGTGNNLLLTAPAGSRWRVLRIYFPGGNGKCP